MLFRRKQKKENITVVTTKKELNECIKNAEIIVEKMLFAIEEAKKTTIKTEE